MAMTRAEKERLEELETALAMHWPSYLRPVPMSKDEINQNLVEIPRKDQSIQSHGTHRKAAVGWFFNSYSMVVTKGWSDGYHINRNSSFGDEASRGEGEQMFKTKSEAAMAMRIEVTKDFARKLAAVDRMILSGDDQ